MSYSGLVTFDNIGVNSCALLYIASQSNTFLVPKDCHRTLEHRPSSFCFHPWILAFFHSMLFRLLDWLIVVVRLRLISSDYLIQYIFTVLVDTGCTLLLSAFGGSQAKVACYETRRERLSTLLLTALNPREVRARQGCTDESENKARVGEGCSHVCRLKWVGLKLLLPRTLCCELL